MKTCFRCQCRTKDWDGDDPKCGFPEGDFTRDNWRCATLNVLRRLAEPGAVYSEDQYASVISDGDGGHVLITWYKSRGRTEGAYLVTDQGVYPLTLGSAETVIRNNEDKPGGAS